MATGWGTREIAKAGSRIGALAVAGSGRQKVAGVTIDWSTVPAAGGDTTLTDGTVIKAGEKFIRYGTVIAKITASGKFGPYDAAALDGRDTLVRGECFIVEETIVEKQMHSLYAPGGVYDGGIFFLARCVNNAGDLTTNPTRTQMEAAFPDVTWAED